MINNSSEKGGANLSYRGCGDARDYSTLLKLWESLGDLWTLSKKTSTQEANGGHGQ